MRGSIPGVISGRWAWCCMRCSPGSDRFEVTDPVPLVFSGSERFDHTHGLGQKPTVTVVDSDGFEIDVCVKHTTDNIVTLFFNGTLTDAVLILE